MGLSTQHQLKLNIKGARHKQLLSDKISSIKSSLVNSSKSTRALYQKCFKSSKSKTEVTWRVSVSPDEETGESMQITMLSSKDDGMNVPSSTSASSEESDAVRNPCVIASASGGEKRSSKFGNLFKGSSKNEGNNESDKQNSQGGDENPNDQSNGNGGSNEDKNGSSDNNNNGNGRSENFDPLTYFGPERISFAQQSTLPLHSGKECEAPTSQPSWTPATGKNFHVRVGPNYVKTGKKAPSLENLYEVYSVRYFRSPCRTVGGATRIMPLPEMLDHCGKEEGKDDVDTATEGVGKLSMNGETVLKGGNSSHPELKSTKIPDVLVVHFMLPYKDPNMFKQNDDGPGGECVYYLRPSQRFLDEVSGKIAMTPGTRLFCRWCNECQSNVELRSRFKCMALVRDIEKHNFGLLKSYNGKPVLITESGRVNSGFHGDVRYLEMTANGKYFASQLIVLCVVS